MYSKLIVIFILLYFIIFFFILKHVFKKIIIKIGLLMSESDTPENIKDNFFIEDSQSKFFKKFVNLYNKSQNK